MNLRLSIFPYKAKPVGYILILLAIPFCYLYFWGGKPAIFNVKVFAVITTYLETRYFAMSQTNLLDELAAILFISGTAIVSFSKEKKEEKYYETMRVKALIKAMFFTIVFWLVSFLLIYGMAIFLVSFSVFIVFLITYNFLFQFYLLKDKKERKTTLIFGNETT